MVSAYRDADVVVCRSGALTIAELTAAGVGALLVPYPHAVDDHQTANARFMAHAQAGLLLPQSQLTAANLAEVLGGLNRTRCLEWAEQARTLALPHSAEDVADIASRHHHVSFRRPQFECRGRLKIVCLFSDGRSRIKTAFTLKIWHRISLPFRIKPLCAAALKRPSETAARIRSYDEKQGSPHSFRRHRRLGHVRHCRSVAQSGLPGVRLGSGAKRGNTPFERFGHRSAIPATPPSMWPMPMWW